MAELTPDDARAMVARAFPQWSGEAITPVHAAGTAHALFRLGTDKVVRIPRDRAAAAHVAAQDAVLATFAGLPLEVPRVLATAGPVANCPFAWSVLGWIEGQDAARAQVADWTVTACALGEFVAAMRDCDTGAGAVSGPRSAYRGAGLVAVDGWMRGAITAIADLFDAKAMTAAWEVALAVPPWPGPPGWVHGDLHPANLIVRDGRLAAVIDFGLASLGDPACDLAPAWTFLPAPSREAFRVAAGLDAAAWQRGRGWALYAGAIALAHYRETNPTLARMGRAAVAEVLDSR